MSKLLAKDNSKEKQKECDHSPKQKTSYRKSGKQEQDEMETQIDEHIRLLETSNEANSNMKSLEHLKTMIITATGVASIPIAMKVLYYRYDTLKQIYDKKAEPRVNKLLAQIISLIAVAHPSNSDGDVLKYYLLSDLPLFKSCSISFIREMSKDLIWQWKHQSESQLSNKFMLKLILDCAVYFVTQNSELEACDLLIETEQLKDQVESLKLSNDRCNKLCNYLIACLPYLVGLDKNEVLECSYLLCLKNNFLVEALYIALFGHDNKMIENIVMKTCQNVHIRKQMLIILARHNRLISSSSLSSQDRDLLNNKSLNSYFLGVAQKLDVIEPKSPNDVLNSSKVNVEASSIHLLHLGSSFMNGFINAGYGKDKLYSEENAIILIEKHKDSGKMSAAASIGLLNLWDTQNGLSKINKFKKSEDMNIKAGTLLAYGIHLTSVGADFNDGFEYLKGNLNDKYIRIRIASIVGLSIAYVGSNHSKSIDAILQIVCDTKNESDLIGISAISCGAISSTAGKAQVVDGLVQALKNPKHQAKDRMDIMLAIGLCFLGRSDLLKARMNLLLNQLNDFPQLRDQLQLYIEICALVGSSNIVKIQEMVNTITEIETNKIKEAKSSTSLKRAQNVTNEDIMEAISVLGIGLLSIGDELNSEMILRSYHQFLRFGDARLKKATLLSLALTYVSNPKLPVIEIFSKYSHSSEYDVAFTSIFGLGFIGAGTNNTRIILLLTKLTVYYARKAEFQFAIRVAAGLLCLGKGLLTLNPLMEMKLIRYSSITGMLVVLHQLLKPTQLLTTRHYFLYYLACAFQTNVVMTVDTDLKFLPISVRVGQAVDTTGQAGKPREIISYQTIDTPVLLKRNEKAEIATDKFIPLNPILHGCVIVKKNDKPQS